MAGARLYSRGSESHGDFPGRAASKLNKEKTSLLALLEVVEEDAALLGLLTPILDDNARAVDDLAGVALAVDLAYSMY